LPGLGLASWMAAGWPHPARAAIGPYPAPRNDAYVGGRALTPEDEATTYTNFYEFGASKNIWRRAQKLVTDPWSITIDGLVETPMTIDAEDLLRQLGGLEERIYRHRCVEAWAMTVPWSGVALSRLIAFARPAASAKYSAHGNIYGPIGGTGAKAGLVPMALC
jgi:sulfoxide reductase catalytic subunit YedY